MSSIDALLGRIFVNGEEKELRGGIDFSGFVVEPENDESGKPKAWRIVAPEAPGISAGAVSAVDGARLTAVSRAFAMPVACLNLGASVYAVSSNYGAVASMSWLGPCGIVKIDPVTPAVADIRDYQQSDARKIFIAFACVGGSKIYAAASASALNLVYLAEFDPSTGDWSTKQKITATSGGPMGLASDGTRLFYVTASGGALRLRSALLASPDTQAEASGVLDPTAVYLAAVDTRAANYGDATARVWLAGTDGASFKLYRWPLTGFATVTAAEAEVSVTVSCYGLAVGASSLFAAGSDGHVREVDPSAATVLNDFDLSATFAGGFASALYDAGQNRVWLLGYDGANHLILARMTTGGSIESSAQVGTAADEALTGALTMTLRGDRIWLPKTSFGDVDPAPGSVYSAALTGTVTPVLLPVPDRAPFWRL